MGAVLLQRLSPMLSWTRPLLVKIHPVLGDAQFRHGLTHGLAILGGGYIGLILWALFLATPMTPSVTPPKPDMIAPASTPTTAHHDAPAPAPQPPAKSADTGAPKTTLPFPGLFSDMPPYGRVPQISPDNQLTPFDAYRRAFAADKLNQPLVAVVMLDYGLSEKTSQSIIGVMPPQVTLALSPVARHGDKIAQTAFDAGHELWLDLSVEPADFPRGDDGAHTLLTAASVEDNRAALLSQLGAHVGYAGVLGRGASPYYTSGADADFMAGLIFDQGLGLVINAPDVAPVITTQAKQNKNPYYAGSFVTLPDLARADTIAQHLSRVEEQAKTNGFAVLLFSPSKIARGSLLAWLPTLSAKNIALAPLSIIAERGTDLMKK